MHSRGQTGATLQARYTARTDVGRVRSINEDSVFAGQLLVVGEPDAASPHLLVVADGVGGLERGEWASEKALSVVTAELPIQLAAYEPREALKLALQTANDLIWRREGSAAESHLGPAATTMVAVLVDDRHLWWANVGDSRAYLVGEDGVYRLTRDHSWVEEQLRTGTLTPEQARMSGRRNVITRSIGFEPQVDVDTGGPVELCASDIVILCSDGLYGLLSDDDIARIARAHAPAEAADRLIELSNERGGTDNISVIVCEFVDGTADGAT